MEPKIEILIDKRMPRELLDAANRIKAYVEKIENEIAFRYAKAIFPGVDNPEVISRRCTIVATTTPRPAYLPMTLGFDYFINIYLSNCLRWEHVAKDANGKIHTVSEAWGIHPRRWTEVFGEDSDSVVTQTVA